MASREETLAKIDAFNKKAEEMRQAASAPPVPPEVQGITPAGVPNAVTEEQKRILQAPVDTLSTAQAIEKKALQTQTELTREQHERDEAERRRQREESNTIQRMQDAGSNAASAALNAAGPPVRWLESIPTPAGLGSILAIIALFLLAIVPVNAAGDTRLKLIWYTITGKTHLNYSVGQAAGGGTSSPGQTSQQQQSTSQIQSIPIDMSNIPDLTGLDLTNL